MKIEDDNLIFSSYWGGKIPYKPDNSILSSPAEISKEVCTSDGKKDRHYGDKSYRVGSSIYHQG
jgi:hypothetical protein